MVNIKADFLGLTKEINGVDLSKKWVATQKGCPMHCKFCDVPKFGFYGNASIEDMDPNYYRRRQRNRQV